MTVQEVVNDCGWKRGCVAEWAGVVPATMVAHRTTEILQALHRFVSEVHCAVPQVERGRAGRTYVRTYTISIDINKVGARMRMRSEDYSTWSVCLSVCVFTTILGLQATRGLIRYTNSFSATRARKITWRFC